MHPSYWVWRFQFAQRCVCVRAIMTLTQNRSRQLYSHTRCSMPWHCSGHRPCACVLHNRLNKGMLGVLSIQGCRALRMHTAKGMVGCKQELKPALSRCSIYKQGIRENMAVHMRSLQAPLWASVFIKLGSIVVQTTRRHTSRLQHHKGSGCMGALWFSQRMAGQPRLLLCRCRTAAGSLASTSMARMVEGFCRTLCPGLKGLLAAACGCVLPPKLACCMCMLLSCTNFAMHHASPPWYDLCFATGQTVACTCLVQPYLQRKHPMRFLSAAAANCEVLCMTPSTEAVALLEEQACLSRDKLCVARP